MNRDRKALLLFEQGLEISAEQLGTFLEEACDGDSQLRSKVETLLATVNESSNLLPENPLAELSMFSAVRSETALSCLSGNRSLLKPDYVLADRYKILAILGVGGMGEVYRAHDSRLDRQVAIKVMNKANLSDPGMHERFEREIRLIAALTHPNIVMLHDVSRHGEMQFAVMELLEGKTLRQLINEGLDWPTTAKLVQGVAAGLSSAHSQNLMHRDIKPENVIVTNEGCAKILDFGLARPEVPAEHQNLTATAGLAPGTVPYMSPEQAESKPLTCSTDIFSFGTVIFEMLTGVNPFRAETALQTMRNVTESILPEQIELLFAVPQEVISLLTAMLQKRPDERPTSADVVYQLGALHKLTENSDSTAVSNSEMMQLKSATPNNLPMRRIELTGREHELTSVSEELREHALLTLVGPGGVGKTSLAIETARQLSREFPGGIWICEFAPVRDESAVSEVLAAALDGNAGTISEIEHVVTRLQEQPTLLLFDNCEHVIDAAAELAELLVERVAKLTILSTSRESLGIPGERVIHLEGLAFDGADSDAAKLFASRASAIARYHPAPEKDQLIEQIVARLEGLPLAIELAVPQLASMSLEELLEELDDQMNTLRSGRQPCDRQATVRQTIAWSYDLLAEEERVLLLSLSVFSGRFTSEAASRVGMIQSGIRRKLQRLVEQSVLVRSEHQGLSRFRLLEPIRQYCQSIVDSQSLGEARERHAYFFAERASVLGKGIYGDNEMACADALNLEWPDLRKAIAWGREHAAVAVAVDPIVALTRAAMFQLRVEAFQWMMAAIETFGPQLAGRADVNHVLGTGMWLKGDHDQAQIYLDRCNELGDYAPNYYMQYAQLFHLHRFDEALQAIEQGREVAATQADELEMRWLSMPFAANTLIMTEPADPGIDESMLSEGRRILELDWPTGHAYFMMVQGTIAMMRGDLPAAQQTMKESIEKSNSCGNRALAALVSLFLDGMTNTSTSAEDRLESAIKNLKVMLDAGTGSQGKVSAYPVALRSLILALAECNQLEAAARCSGILETQQGLGDHNQLSPEFMPTMQKVEEQLGSQTFAKLRHEGQFVTISKLVDQASQLLDRLRQTPEKP